MTLAQLADDLISRPYSFPRAEKLLAVGLIFVLRVYNQGVQEQ